MVRHATYEAKTAGNGERYWSTTGENGERLARSGETFLDYLGVHHNSLLTAEAILHGHPDQAAIHDLVLAWLDAQT